jgi:hypothetical protein
VFVSEQQKSQDELEEVNADLQRSLRLCHSIIDDYRTKLAANTNDEPDANEDFGRRERAHRLR